MLFHGTGAKGAEGILSEGFVNSKKGWSKNRVYLTDMSSKALYYASRLKGNPKIAWSILLMKFWDLKICRLVISNLKIVETKKQS